MRVTETSLLITSLVLSIAGLATLLVAIHILEANPISYETFINSTEVRVVLHGNITDTRVSGNTTFVKLKTECEIPGVLFEARQLTKGNAVVTGTKKYYKGMPELIIDEVRYETLS